ncbi:Uncharacterised protein [Serratia fonticola]|nr:hypothetical protein DFO62_102262 [Serratia fonticola]CAI0960288.1 Uncharacterised protein [Serratia fonticola]
MVTAQRMYCRECRDNSGQSRARAKIGEDYYRQITVLEKKDYGKYQCRCGQCGRVWISTSSEAEEIFNKSKITR